MNINIHIPLYLGSSLFNQLLMVGRSGYFQELPYEGLCGAGPELSSVNTLCGLFCSPVQEEDEQKRLLVTVWNRAGDSR